jgi:hypothetical protein
LHLARRCYFLPPEISARFESRGDVSFATNPRDEQRDEIAARDFLVQILSLQPAENIISISLDQRNERFVRSAADYSRSNSRCELSIRDNQPPVRGV